MTTNMDISRSKHAPASACPHYKPPPQKMAGSLKLDAVGSTYLVDIFSGANLQLICPP